MNKSIYIGILALASSAALSSCSDWTDPEPVDVVHDGIAQTQAQEYAKYLQNLREYRKNDHKRVYAWFENKGSFTSQADHIDAVPDSIDVLVLADPSIVSGDALYDMTKKRDNTGMLMACTVDYNAILADWNALNETGDTPSPWAQYLGDTVDKILSDASTASLNRVIAAYQGKSPATMSADELSTATQDQETFFGKILAWANSADRAYDFLGMPASVIKSDYLQQAGVIFLSETASVTSTIEYQMVIARSSANGVPTDRFAVIAPLPGVDANQNPVGKWGDQYTSWVAAEWCRGADVKAMGLTNLAKDYYNPSFIYPVCRRAIQILNPAAK